MKLFIAKISIFCVPLLVVLSVLFFKKANREFCYNYIKGDCDARGKLFYKKLYTHSNTVDYLFVGSSKTMNGINDALIEDSINKVSSKKIHLYNAGYCRFGRDLDFLFIKEFAKNNLLKKVFVEVRADESTTSHPIYPYLANGKEILISVLALNGKLFPEIYNHVLLNVNYLRTQMHLEIPEKNTETNQVHGYNNIDRVLEKELLDEFKATENNKYANASINTNALEYHYSNFYLNKMKTFCDKNNIELNFIYMPSFGNIAKEPAFKSYYQSMGKLIIGPDSIFNNQLYWKDVAHFNTAGATAFSNFLSKEITK